MADDITLPGEGIPVATDEVGGKHYQKIKLYDPTPDSVNPIGVTSNPLRTDPTLTNAEIIAPGKIVGTALTTSYQTLLSMDGAARSVELFNSCNETVLVSFDNGTTLSVELEANEFWSKDYASLGLQLPSNTIAAKHAGTLPTTGSIRAVITR